MDDVKTLEAEATRMLRELSSLTAKLRELGDKSPEELGQTAVDAVGAQIKSLQAEFTRLTENAPKTMAELDKSVRTNPYLYILGALGLGWLLGKVMRS